MNDNKRLEGLNIPEHIAFIMDGNGRWAQEKGKKRTAGHKEGANTLRDVCESSHKFGVKYVTVYAFSTENWKRSDQEVSFLMNLLKQFLKDSIKESKKNNMRVRVIGDISPFPDDIKKSIKKMEEASSQNTGLNLQVALNYGSRDEITRSVKEIARAIKAGNIDVDDINEALITQNLDTNDIPDPDLLIRPGKEQRLSNYLLWQLAYAEFYFCECYWPDFNTEELIRAIETYNKVERRFGGVINED